MKDDLLININKRVIGSTAPVFIIAELSANHNQDFDIAVETVKAAKEVGADAIKLQTYTADTITIDSSEEYFQLKDGLWKGKNLYQLYKEAYTPWEWQPKLKKIADALGLICFSSPFDKSAVDFLDKMNVPAYKIASLEITDIPLIQYIALRGKPIFISTGIATKNEIQEAVDACREVGNNQIILLKCTSTYPAPINEANLRMISDLSTRFGVISGLSDHTLGISVPVASVCMGAKVIEKHFILDKKIGGPDAAFSLDKIEFKTMVDGVREAEQAIGSINYILSEEVKKPRAYCRSLFIIKDMEKGDLFSEQNIRSIRPGQGLAPKYYDTILGRKVNLDVKKGTAVSWDLID